jgi:5-methyltetrahydrofolate--homocysteine methyltransferase
LRCGTAEVPDEALERVLAEAERGLDTAKPLLADLLLAATEAIEAHWAMEPTAQAEVALASLSGDSHDVGRRLWDAVLTRRGVVTHDFGVRPAAIIASRAADLAPDAIAVFCYGRAVRRPLQALVAHLLRAGLRTPLIIGGPGVDERYAQWVAMPAGGSPYWGGVYYCEDALQVLQVLQQVVLFEAPPSSHTHAPHGSQATEEACASCGGCPLVASCDLTEGAP